MSQCWSHGIAVTTRKQVPSDLSNIILCRSSNSHFPANRLVIYETYRKQHSQFKQRYDSSSKLCSINMNEFVFIFGFIFPLPCQISFYFHSSFILSLFLLQFSEHPKRWCIKTWPTIRIEWEKRLIQRQRKYSDTHTQMATHPQKFHAGVLVQYYANVLCEILTKVIPGFGGWEALLFGQVW